MEFDIVQTFPEDCFVMWQCHSLGHKILQVASCMKLLPLLPCPPRPWECPLETRCPNVTQVSRPIQKKIRICDWSPLLNALLFSHLYHSILVWEKSKLKPDAFVIRVAAVTGVRYANHVGVVPIKHASHVSGMFLLILVPTLCSSETLPLWPVTKIPAHSNATCFAVTFQQRPSLLPCISCTPRSVECPFSHNAIYVHICNTPDDLYAQCNCTLHVLYVMH